MTSDAKIFGIGLGRTGGASLAEALRALDRSTMLFPRSAEEVTDHDAAVGLPVAAAFQDLDAAFPDSRFILTLRGEDDWLRSMERDMARQSVVFDIDPELRELQDQVYGAPWFDPDLYAAAAARHEAEVRDHFADRPGQLLIMDLVAGDGWEALCPFLDVRSPSGPFPALNRGAAFDGLAMRLLAVSDDADWVAVVASVSLDYLDMLAESPAYAAHDEGAPLPLDRGERFRITLHRALERFGAVDEMAEALGRPDEDLWDLLGED